MSDRICPCGKIFTAKYLLKRHQNSKLGCIDYLMSLNSHSTEMHTEHKEREGGKSIKEYFCKYCNRKLASKFSMERHYNSCDKNDDNKTLNNNDITNSVAKLLPNVLTILSQTFENNSAKFELDIKTGKIAITSLKNIEDNNLINSLEGTRRIVELPQTIPVQVPTSSSATLPVKQSKGIINTNINIPEVDFIEEADDVIQLVIKDSQLNTSNASISNSNNTYSPSGTITNANNSTNPTITNITNNISNNDANNKVPFVYPFGYENINFLTEEEVIEILKADNGAVLLLEKIHSHGDNNNFMKANKKDKHMMFFDKPNNVEYCSDKEFLNKLFTHNKLLIDRIYFTYYKRLQPKYQHIIWQNIQKVKETLDTKPFSIGEQYGCIIAKKTNNPSNKRVFNDVKKGIEEKNNKIIDKNTTAFNASSSHIEALNYELANSTLNVEEINKIWEELNTDKTASYDEFKNDLLLHRFEETPRFKLIQTLIKKELEYKYKQKCNIGDIDMFYSHVNKRVEAEIEHIKLSFPDITDEYLDEIKYLLITKPLENAKIELLGLQRLLPPSKNTDIVKS